MCMLFSPFQGLLKEFFIVCLQKSKVNELAVKELNLVSAVAQWHRVWDFACSSQEGRQTRQDRALQRNAGFRAGSIASVWHCTEPKEKYFKLISILKLFLRFLTEVLHVRTVKSTACDWLVAHGHLSLFNVSLERSKQTFFGEDIVWR